MSDTPTLDFSKVEALRKHMLLNVTQMAKALGVSRVTYSGWTKGKPLRKSNDANVRAILRKMFRVIEDHKWPQPDIIGMAPVQRFNTLLELMADQE